MMFDIRKIQEKVIYEAVKTVGDETLASEIVYGNSEESNAQWVKSTMEKLEKNFERADIIKIRRGCQCGYGMDEKLSLVKELIAMSSSYEEFGNLPKARAAGLSYKDGDLYLEFPFCPCPMLAEVGKLDNDTWCQCTTGYSKVLFEKAFECNVEVELLKSVKMGDDKCLMKIIPEKEFML